MVGLDLDEAPELLARTPWHAWRRPAWVRYRRQDYHAPAAGPDLAAVLRQRWFDIGGSAPERVELVTVLRQGPWSFNPVSFYFGRDSNGTLTHVAAEITNTPWHERHLHCFAPPADGVHRYAFPKAFHVSPFMPMDQHYVWTFRERSGALLIDMRLFEHGRQVFQAGFAAAVRPATPSRLWRAIWSLPCGAVYAVAGIYWQALRLWLKGVTFYSHPAAAAKPAPARASHGPTQPDMSP